MVHRAALFGIAATAAICATAAWAQSPHDTSHGEKLPLAETMPPHPLPPPVVTHHQLDLSGKTLRFKAVTGPVRLSDAQSGAPIADIATIAFEREDQTTSDRPLTIVVNGGPGASSAWLDLGGIGPWRLQEDIAHITPSQPPTVIDNLDTWLDFTDLLFIDPLDTGYSRAVGKSETDLHRFFTVDGDINMLSTVIRKWLVTNDRLASRKFILGESYGGFRAPKLAKRLEREDGVGINGIILLSPVLDFDWFWSDSNPGTVAAHLPSLVAASKKIGGPHPREKLAAAEAYSSGDYLVDLFKGVRDPQAIDRESKKVAELTGLDERVIARFGGRVDAPAMLRESLRNQKRIASAYDGEVTGYDPDPYANFSHRDDPILDSLKTPLAAAMADVTAHRLNWPIQARYEILNLQVSSHWDWGDARHSPEVLGDLASLLSLDPTFKAVVMHGVADQVTPYYASKMLIDQIPSFGDSDRLQLLVYGGGHMPYLEPGPRAAMHDDARKLIAPDAAAQTHLVKP